MKRIILLLAAVLVAVPAFGLTFDQNATPDVIFGSGNANGSFTVDRQGPIELGLRGKLRFDTNNQPQNIFNSNGDGTYNFVAGAAPSGFGWLPSSATTPVWNFEFTVNVDVDGLGVNKLDDFSYELGLDFNPDDDVPNFLVFDPITPTVLVPFYDHSFGDNSTTALTDFVAGDGPTYTTYLSTYNVAQNSWNYEFFNNPPFDSFDPTVPGVYDIYLKAFQGTTEVASTSIKILVGGAVDSETSSWGAVKSLFR